MVRFHKTGDEPLVRPRGVSRRFLLTSTGAAWIALGNLLAVLTFFFYLAFGNTCHGREVTDVLIDPDHYAAAGFDKETLVWLNQAGHFHLAFVNHNKRFSGGIDRNAEIRTAHGDGRGGRIYPVRVGPPADPIDDDTNTADENVKEIPDRCGGTIVFENDARPGFHNYYAAIAEPDGERSAPACIDLGPGQHQFAPEQLAGWT